MAGARTYDAVSARRYRVSARRAQWVNNAGVVPVAPIVDESDDGWHTTIALNATGVVYGMRAAMPALRRSGDGSINSASI